MNKHLKRTLALTALLFAVSGCTAPGGGNEEEQEHVHSFESTYTYNAEEHWRKCNKEGCEQVASRDVHQLGEYVQTLAPTQTTKGSKEATCSVCGYKDVKEIDELPHVHTFSSEWSSDDNQHWHAATCEHSNEKGSVSNHTFIADTSKTDVPATETSTGTHYVICSVCGKEKEETVPVLPKPEVTEELAVTWNRDSGSGTNITFEQGSDELAGYSVFGFDTLTAYKQPLTSSVTISSSEYTKAAFEIKNLSTYDIKLRLLIQTDKDAGGSRTSMIEAVSITSNGGSTAQLYNAASKIVAKAGDTMVVKVELTPELVAKKIALQVDEELTSAGSFAMKNKVILTKASGSEEQGEEKTINFMSTGITGATGFTVTPNEGIYDVSYTQPTNGYNYVTPTGSDSKTYSEAKYVVVKIKNTSAREIYCDFVASNKVDSTTTGLVKSASLLSSEDTTSRFERVTSAGDGAYFYLGASDTAEFKINLVSGVTSMNRLRLILDVKATEEISGTVTILDWYVVDTVIA